MERKKKKNFHIPDKDAETYTQAERIFLLHALSRQLIAVGEATSGGRNNITKQQNNNHIYK